VSSLVLSILESAGDEAFALVVGQKSVSELRSDGTLKRTGLRKFLRGGVGTLSIVRTGMEADALPEGYEELTTFRSWNGQSVGKTGFRDDDPGTRWRMLDGNPYYLSRGGERIGATVLVDSGAGFVGEARFDPPTSERYEASEQSLLLTHDGLLVLPHTYRVARFVDGYVTWVRDGRLASPPRPLPEPEEWDRDAPPDPERYTQLVPVSADFKVTGLVQHGAWRDASDLEAARSLLESRFDLKIGIWDLVSNPTLRRTLLDSAPVSVAPTTAAEVPAAAAKRAELQVAEKVAERETESKALRAVAERLKSLYAAGWTDDRGRGPFRRLIGEPISVWPGEEPVPLVALHLAINKRETSVSVSFRMSNQLAVGSYLITRQEAFEHIAAPDSATLSPEGLQVLWRADGGWADDVDWERRAQSLAQRTNDWVEELNPLVDDSRRFLEEKEQSRQTQADAARKRQAEALAAQWEQDFAALEAFVAREGHARVPRDHIENGTNLYSWWFHQMSEYRRGRLSPSQIKRLEAQPRWSWDQLSAHWEKLFAVLETYVTREGNADVPQGHKENSVPLGSWVRSQQWALKRGKLSALQKTRLEALPGWRWTTS
jgi:hypothetical protein